jgi:sugar/nucleoside kinase (ribokinase family)
LKEAEGLEMADLLSINVDEAARLGRISSCESPDRIVRACAKRAWTMNPAMKLCVSNGRHGLFGAEKGRIVRFPGLKVRVKNTAGAGDALLAGIIIGIIRGYPFKSCLELGRNLSARSVESADTINFGIKKI